MFLICSRPNYFCYSLSLHIQYIKKLIHKIILIVNEYSSIKIFLKELNDSFDILSCFLYIFYTVLYYISIDCFSLCTNLVLNCYFANLTYFDAYRNSWIFFGL